MKKSQKKGRIGRQKITRADLDRLGVMYYDYQARRVVVRPISPALYRLAERQFNQGHQGEEKDIS